MASDPFNWTETIRSKSGTIFHSLLVQFIAKPVPSKGGLLSFHSKVWVDRCAGTVFLVFLEKVTETVGFPRKAVENM